MESKKDKYKSKSRENRGDKIRTSFGQKKTKKRTDK